MISAARCGSGSFRVGAGSPAVNLVPAIERRLTAARIQQGNPMKILSRPRLRTKLGLLLALSTTAVVAIAVMSATTLHDRMLEDRIDKLRDVVNTTTTIALDLEAQVTAEAISREQAIEQFHRDVRAIRFDAGLGYLSVMDTRTGNAVMHGTNPALEGKPAPIDIGTGKPISDLVLAAIRSSDEGVATYWFPRPGQTVPLRKIAVITEISSVSTTIAAAVDQQGAATAEIARNVQQTSVSAQEITSNIGGVSQAANAMGAAADQVLGAASELSRQAEQLAGQVNNFLAGVRAA